ncbi:PilW family protein [Psychromonas sp. KJ10-10]|uniref:PilW family protein n=1 Tax=Psychromonas sp. KJ10-10 TaxID=3391823 RepID=UPI0039B3E374
MPSITIAKPRIYISKQRGFSLIELMIAMVLGLLVMFSVLQVFTASMQSTVLQNAYARVQENGRMSLELISRDIRVADFWGCLHDTSLITNHLDSSYDATFIPTNQLAVTGGNNVTSLTIAGISVADDTDTITLRGAKSYSNVKVTTPHMINNASDITIINGASIVNGDVILISDCVGADLFSNSSNNTNLISHADALSNVYSSSAQILSPYYKIYFIGTNSSAGSSLFVNNNGTAQELIRGVTDLQITYGEDTNSDATADQFSIASSVTDMDQVLSISFTIVTEDSSSTNQIQKNYALTTNIRNRTLQ